MPVVAKIDVPPPEPFVEGEEGAEARGAGYRFIAPRTATEPLVFQSAEGSAFLWTPTELVYGDADGHLDYIAGSAPAAFTVRGRAVHYPRTFPASEEVHVVLPEGRKYWLYLYEPPRLPGAHLSGDVWFGVSGMVGGIPLPPGRHREMEAFGFRFQPVYAEDTMGARVEGWYEVIDTDLGQQLFICIPADWLLDPGRVFPIKIDPSVVVQGGYSLAASSQVKVDQFSNGVLLAIFGGSGQTICRFSADKGQNWLAPASGGVIYTGGTIVQYVSMRILHDDDTIHLLIGNRYYIGVPNAERTDYTWTFVFSISYYEYADLEVRKSESNWIAYIVYGRFDADPEAGTYAAALYYRRYVIAPDYTYTASSQKTIISLQTSDVAWGWMPSLGWLPDNSLYLVANRASRWHRYYLASPDTSDDWKSEGTDTFGVLGGTHVLPDEQGNVYYVQGNGNAVGQPVRVYKRSPDGTTSQLPNPPIDVSTLATSFGLTMALGSDNKLYLFFIKNKGGLWLTIYDGATWSDPVMIDSDSTAAYCNATKRQANMIVVLYRTGSSSSGYTIKSHVILLNQPPQQPTNLTRPNFDATEDAVFTWQHNDPDPSDGQAQYQLQIRPSGSDTDLVDTGEVQSPMSEYLLPGGTLENGKTYQWRVRTADQSGEWSPWSDYAVFQTGPKPVATILSPAAGATVSTSDVTVEWSVASQSAATIRLYDGAGQTVLQEHEVTTPSARARTITGLQNNTSYQVSVQPVSTIGVTGDEVFSGPFDVAYTPPPKPTATAAGQAGFIRVSIINPAPAEGEPEVTHNDLYRRDPGGAWVRIATGIEPDGTYDDYAVGSGVVYEYRARAVGDNGTYTDSQLVQAATAWEGWRFTPAGDPTREVRFLSDWAARRSLDEDRQEVVTRGRYPITFRGPSRPARLDLTAVFDDDGELTAGEWARRIYALSGVLGYLRSPDGDIWYGELYAPSDDWRRDLVTNPRVVSVQFVEKGPVPKAV